MNNCARSTAQYATTVRPFLAITARSPSIAASFGRGADAQVPLRYPDTPAISSDTVIRRAATRGCSSSLACPLSRSPEFYLTTHASARDSTAALSLHWVPHTRYLPLYCPTPRTSFIRRPLPQSSLRNRLSPFTHHRSHVLNAAPLHTQDPTHTLTVRCHPPATPSALIQLSHYTPHPYRHRARSSHLCRL